MFRNMKLGAKIASGFGIMIAIAVILGTVAVGNMTAAKRNAVRVRDEYVRENAILSELERRVLKLMYHIRGYALTEDKKYLGLAGEESAGIRENLDNADKLAGEYPELAVLSRNADEMNEKYMEYEMLVKITSEKINAMDEARKNMDNSAASYIKECSAYLDSQSKSLEREMDVEADAAHLKARFRKTKMINKIINLGNEVIIKNFMSQALRKPELVKSGISAFDDVEKIINDLKKVTRLKAGLDELDRIASASIEYRKALDVYLKNWSDLNTAGEKRDTAGLEVSLIAEKTATETRKAMEKESDDSVSSLGTSSFMLSAGLAAAFSTGCLLAFAITSGITGPVRKIITGLSEGSGQVASAAEQVSESSHSLAEGSSEQTSSLEKTSSSIEEMSSMTMHNAKNAVQADTLMRQVSKIAEKASESMKALTKSIEEISAASSQTQIIIKTIDGIAFQTNLLALNAAVEAARAGEAGTGFAVVAEEVRKLALRSAEAARNTAVIIENTVIKVRTGTSLLDQTNTEFDEVTETASKVGQLVSEIASASESQAKGIEQINRAVSEMDKITQRNVANAEESARASEQLGEQSRQMMEYVERLTAIVGKGGKA